LLLPLDDPGFDSSVLCEFRTRLIEGDAEALPFEQLLERFRAHKLLSERSKQPTDSTQVLVAVHALNRLSCAGQTFRHALNVLAAVVPDWFLEHSKPEWGERYTKSFRVNHTVKPSKQAEREALEREVGADGLFLFNAVFANDVLAWFSKVPVIQLLWRVWVQNFTWTEAATLRFRSDTVVPLARAFVNSPFDRDARLS
jgi:transposase